MCYVGKCDIVKVVVYIDCFFSIILVELCIVTCTFVL